MVLCTRVLHHHADEATDSLASAAFFPSAPAPLPWSLRAPGLWGSCVVLCFIRAGGAVGMGRLSPSEPTGCLPRCGSCVVDCLWRSARAYVRTYVSARPAGRANASEICPVTARARRRPGPNCLTRLTWKGSGASSASRSLSLLIFGKRPVRPWLRVGCAPLGTCFGLGSLPNFFSGPVATSPVSSHQSSRALCGCATGEG